MKVMEYTMKEVAEILDVSPATIRKWIDKGYFPNARQGGLRGREFLIPASDLEGRERPALEKTGPKFKMEGQKWSRILITLPPGLKERLDERTKKRGRSRFVAEAIEEKLGS